MTEKFYRVNDSISFNVTSMIDHIRCLADEFDEGAIKEVECCGKVLRSYDDCEELRAELEDYPLWIGAMVTGKVYGRLKAIAEERKMLRYATCVASGMDENKASYSFM